METAQQYLERCLDLLKSEPVSETTMIIMFHEYANLVLKEKQSKNHTTMSSNEQRFYGC
jgi:hypothetical protein